MKKHHEVRAAQIIKILEETIQINKVIISIQEKKLKEYEKAVTQCQLKSIDFVLILN